MDLSVSLIYVDLDLNKEKWIERGTTSYPGSVLIKKKMFSLKSIKNINSYDNFFCNDSSVDTTADFQVEGRSFIHIADRLIYYTISMKKRD